MLRATVGHPVTTARRPFEPTHPRIAGSAEQKEDHTTPANDLNAVEDDEEAKPGAKSKFQECSEADGGCFLPSVLGWKLVAIWKGASFCTMKVVDSWVRNQSIGNH